MATLNTLLQLTSTDLTSDTLALTTAATLTASHTSGLARANLTSVSKVTKLSVLDGDADVDGDANVHVDLNVCVEEDIFLFLDFVWFSMIFYGPLWILWVSLIFCDFLGFSMIFSNFVWFPLYLHGHIPMEFPIYFVVIGVLHHCGSYCDPGLWYTIINKPALGIAVVAWSAMNNWLPNSQGFE